MDRYAVRRPSGDAAIAPPPPCRPRSAQSSRPKIPKCSAPRSAAPADRKFHEQRGGSLHIYGIMTLIRVVLPTPDTTSCEAASLTPRRIIQAHERDSRTDIVQWRDKLAGRTRSGRYGSGKATSANGSAWGTLRVAQPTVVCLETKRGSGRQDARSARCTWPSRTAR